MKKILLPLMLAGLMLTACGNNQTSDNSNGEYDRSSLSIVCPTGAPALAFYRYSTYSNFETNSDPSTGILPQMIAGQKDIVVLPTNAGMQAILNKNANYQIAATITFGNFYLLSMNNDENNTLDENDTILLFQKGNVPDKIFHYVYGDTYNSNIHYVSAVSDAAAAANAGSFVDADTGERMVPNYVMLAQPVLQTVLSKNSEKGYKVYDNIQEKYKEKSNNLPLFQASIFVKKTIDKKKADSFLSSLKDDVQVALDTPVAIASYLRKIENPNQVYGIDPTLGELITKNGNGMGLGFEYAKENKAAVETFLKLFNIEGFDEEVYY